MTCTMARPRNPRLARWAKNERSPRRNDGVTWSRIGGILLCLIGLAALYGAYRRDDFSFETHWPVLGFAAFMLILGWICFRSRLGVSELLADEHSNKR